MSAELARLERSPYLGNVPGTDDDECSPFPTPYVGNGEHSEEQDWPGLFLDVAALLDGGLPDPPAPVSCRRSDGHALFYRAQVNLVFGDAESGKSFLCLAAAAEALEQGRRVLVLDMDHNGPESTVDRLLSLGAPRAALVDRSTFRYVEPDDMGHLDAIVKAASSWRPAVAVVDSVGELLPLLRLSSNSPDDFTLAHARVLKPLAMSGSAVLAIDHLAKNTDSRASGPTGTSAKRRAVGGVALRVTLKDAFTPGHGGAATLTINKDRHGGLRRHCPTESGEPYAGTFVLEDVEGDLTWRVVAPREGDRAPVAAQLARDVQILGELPSPPTSVRDVKERLEWGTGRASAALNAWRDEASSVPRAARTATDTRWSERSSVPHTGGGEHRNTCTVCHEPLDPMLDEATHPCCEPAGAE